MRKFTVILVFVFTFVFKLFAGDGCCQHLSPEEFRAKQKAFITEKAGLTVDEVTKFFPVYFELQDKKKVLNDESWGFINKGKTDKISDAQYGEIIEKVTNNRLAADRLDRLYLNKFKTLLSNKKIYLVQRAEMKFHREILKSMHHKNKTDN